MLEIRYTSQHRVKTGIFLGIFGKFQPIDTPLPDARDEYLTHIEYSLHLC